MSRSINALALVPLALVPLATARFATAHAASHGGGAIALRYRFVPGQTFAYRFIESGRATATGDLSIQDGFTAPYRSIGSATVRERVLSVDARGRAMVAVSVSVLHATETRGRTTTTSPTTTTTVTVQIATDGNGSGTMIGTVNEAFFLPLGTLPAGPLPLKTRWTTPSRLLKVITPALPTQFPHPTVVNTLLSVGPVRGPRGTILATITSAAQPMYAPVTLPFSRRETLRLQGTGQATGRTVFDVASGQLLSSTASYTIELDQQMRDQPGGERTARTRIVWDMSFQRI